MGSERPPNERAGEDWREALERLHPLEDTGGVGASFEEGFEAGWAARAGEGEDETWVDMEAAFSAAFPLRQPPSPEEIDAAADWRYYFAAGWKARARRAGEPPTPDERPRARNGEVCDCETPGDWHRVAGDFQRAMFEERVEVERLREALVRARALIDTEADNATERALNADRAAAVIAAALSSQREPPTPEVVGILQELAEMDARTITVGALAGLRKRARAAVTSDEGADHA